MPIDVMTRNPDDAVKLSHYRWKVKPNLVINLTDCQASFEGSLRQRTSISLVSIGKNEDRRYLGSPGKSVPCLANRDRSLQSFDGFYN